MKLDLRRLRILREVAQHGGVNAAAQNLHYSPSAISQQMAVLERDVGAPVFERRGRGLVLTRVGQTLVEQAEILLAAEGRARGAVEEVLESMAVELTLGMFSTVAAGLLPTIVGDLASRHPHIRLRSREINPDEAGVQLRHGHLDLAFLIDYPDATEAWAPGLTSAVTIADRMRLAAPAGRLVGPRVRLADLADQDWVISGPGTYYGRAVRTACRRAGFEMRVTHEVDGQATALSLVAAGLGVALVSDLGLAFLPAAGAVEVFDLTRPLQRLLVLAHADDDAGRPAVRAVCESTRRAARAALPPSGPAPAQRIRSSA